MTIPSSSLLSANVLSSDNAPASAVYANPVIDADFPDPTIIRAADGNFYAYATQGGEPMHNIQVARSSDLVNWEQLGDAMPVKPKWASRTQDFWAPDIRHADGRYFLYYSARPDLALKDPAEGLALAVAVSEHPEGPFVDVGAPLQRGTGFVNIDPVSFDDPQSGRKLLYWGSGFGAIKVRELADDRISFASGSEAIDLVAPVTTEDPSDYRRLVEGACLLFRDSYYYLLFSGDNCCGPDAHYAVMVARSTSPTGPFELRDRPDHLVVEANDRWLAPGHNCHWRDAAGDDWIIYHAIDRLRPRSRPGDDINTRRVLLMDRLEWVDGWPQVRALGPSSGPQYAPLID